jgi:predicted GNAT superfamily acetyltransferase
VARARCGKEILGHRPMVPHRGLGGVPGGPDSLRPVSLRIEVADQTDSMTAARAVFDEVWPGEGTQVTSNLLRALVHAGGYCSIVLDDDEVVGAALAFPSRDASLPGGVYLHSHMAAVIDGLRDRGIGAAIKQHQRAWAREQGIPVISWTFDPLVRRNAHFNINRLGVEVRAYHPDFYGEMTDAINARDRTDRLVAWWVVDSERAHAAARGDLAIPDHDSVRRIARDLIRLDGGVPQLTDPPEPGETVLVPLPDDVVSLRRVDPALGLQWRLAVREALTSSFATGLRVSAVTSAGAYVLTPEETP